MRFSHWPATKTTIKGDEYFMGYSAMAQWDAVYGPLSGHCLVANARRALFLFLSHWFPLFFLFSSLSFSPFLFLSTLAYSFHYFIIFKHVTFLARPFLPLFLSPSLGGATLQKNMFKIAQSRRLALLGTFLMWLGG